VHFELEQVGRPQRGQRPGAPLGIFLALTPLGILLVGRRKDGLCALDEAGFVPDVEGARFPEEEQGTTELSE